MGGKPRRKPQSDSPSSPPDREYALWIHGKQGDDLAHHLTIAGGDLELALSAWALDLRLAAERIAKLSGLLSHAGVAAVADGNFIALEATDRRGTRLLDDAVDLGLIDATEVAP